MSSKKMGYVILPRSIMDSDIWNNTDPGMYKLFTYCLMKANHNDADYKGIRIKKGSFLTSMKIITKDMKMSENSVRNKLKKLEKLGVIKYESNSRGTKIAIINYQEFQFDTNRATSNFEPLKPSTPSNFEPLPPQNLNPYPPQNLNPNNNDMSNNESKKGMPPHRNEVLAYAKEIEYDEYHAVRFFNHYESTSWKINGKPIKNWKAKMNDWKLRDDANKNNTSAHKNKFSLPDA